MTRYEAAVAMLKQGETFIEFDARQPGVVVPKWLISKSLVLKFSYGFNSSLELTERGITQVLSFGGKHVPCHVPWEAVFAMAVNGHMPLFWTPPPEPVSRPTLTLLRN